MLIKRLAELRPDGCWLVGINESESTDSRSLGVFAEDSVLGVVTCRISERKMSVIVAGIIAGAAHVVTGPDHLAAVAPLIAERPQQGWRLGLRWGVGHGFGVLLLGLAGVLFRDQIDVDLLSNYSERLVGVLLIVIGVWALWRSRGVVVHRHAHHHPADDHAHDHPHEPDMSTRMFTYMPQPLLATAEQCSASACSMVLQEPATF